MCSVNAISSILITTKIHPCLLLTAPLIACMPQIFLLFYLDFQQKLKIIKIYLFSIFPSQNIHLHWLKHVVINTSILMQVKILFWILRRKICLEMSLSSFRMEDFFPFKKVTNLILKPLKMEHMFNVLVT